MQGFWNRSAGAAGVTALLVAVVGVAPLGCKEKSQRVTTTLAPCPVYDGRGVGAGIIYRAKLGEVFEAPLQPNQKPGEVVANWWSVQTPNGTGYAAAAQFAPMPLPTQTMHVRYGTPLKEAPNGETLRMLARGDRVEVYKAPQDREHAVVVLNGVAVGFVDKWKEYLSSDPP